ncbi:MAG: HlyD family efflux transporter periplasmic adaptor subunit [Kofleriaceae bacterium]
MRYEHSNAEMSTMRRASRDARTDWGQGAEPPTHLAADDFEEKRPRSPSRSRSDSIVTSAPRPSKAPTLIREPAPLPEAHSQSRSRSAAGSQPRRLPAPPVAGGHVKTETGSKPQPLPVSAATGSKPNLMPAPAPPATTPAPVLEQAPAFMAFAGGAAFDPNQVPLPLELAPAVYGWVRRLALQADLASADRLLRDAVAELTSSLHVIIIYAGPDGFYSLGPDGELPKDTQPVLAVGKARRALVGPHSGLIPIATATETIAVIQLIRNTRQPVFVGADHITMAAIARESAAVLHHLVVQHLQGQLEHAADKKSLYRPEALDYHRKKGSEGVVTELSPTWIRRAYPVLIGAIIVAMIFGIVVRVPTYSTGFGMIHYPGTPVVTLAQGSLEHLYVQAGDLVKTGDVVAKLSSPKEDADYEQFLADAENARQQYLFDDQDEQARKSVKSASIALAHAKAAVDQRYIHATADGRVSDIHGNENEAINAGTTLMTIVKPGTMPEELAFLPASDRPRIKMEMKLQVGIDGFNKKRPKLPITEISNDAFGAADVRRQVGQAAADTLKIPNDGASYIRVKGTFETDTFMVGKREFQLHEGMSTKAEIQIESKPFFASIFPLFEKYFD